MDLKLKAKFDTLRIEALEAELSKVTNAAAEVIEDLKDKNIELEIAKMVHVKNLKDLNKKIDGLKFSIELKEGRFNSSQNVVRDLRADVAHYQSELETFKDRAQVQLDIDREKTRLAREDAKYWANEAAKFEINCNNCNLS